jgi:hypothetical protein
MLRFLYCISACCWLSLSPLTAQSELKIYACFTDSHRVFVDDWFLPSLKATNPDIKLILEEFPQECSTGNFMSEGWRDTMFKKSTW